MYSQKMADVICGLVLEGKSLRRIANLDSMPQLRTMCRWLAENKEFRQQFDQCKEMMAHVIADEIIEISDDESRDLAGELQIPNSVAVNRAKLRIDTRKWVASKLLPKQYGDKIQQEVTGTVGLQLIHDIPRPIRKELDAQLSSDHSLDR